MPNAHIILAVFQAENILPGDLHSDISAPVDFNASGCSRSVKKRRVDDADEFSHDGESSDANIRNENSRDVIVDEELPRKYVKYLNTVLKERDVSNMRGIEQLQIKVLSLFSIHFIHLIFRC